MDLSALRYEPLARENHPEAREMLGKDPAPGEAFLRLLDEVPEYFVAAFLENRLAALAQTGKPASQSFLRVFVAPECRRQGIGSSLVHHMESRLREGGTQKVRCAFRAGLDGSRAFAQKLGYEPYFFSAFMQRTGSPFPLEALPVRMYEDADYAAAQALYARAFHEMRLRTGCFPDSVIAPPSEEERLDWQNSATDRFVYEQDGEIAGVAHLWGNELSSVCVHPEYQGRGIGRKFVMYLCNELYRRGYPAVTLWCVMGNYARHLYDSLGFKEQYIEEYRRKTL